MKKSSVKAKGGQNKTNSLGDLISLLRRLKVFRSFFTTSTKNTLTGRRSNYIKSQTAFRVLGTVAISSLVLLFATVIAPIYNTTNSVEATTGTATESTLTFTSTNATASVNLAVNDTAGTFATSTEAQKAAFSIATDNYTGYTLTIKSSSCTTSANCKLGDVFPSITSSATSDNFAVNTWGYMPSYYNSAANTTNYYPAPTTSATTLRVTNVANDTEDEYTIALGLKADFTNASGAYANDTFVLEYVANPIAYSISFADNTGDAIGNMPSNTGTQSTSETTVALPNNVPTRTGYTFAGWCNVAPTNSGTTCGGTTFGGSAGGGTYGIDQTSSNTGVTLYALWTPNTYNLVITADANVSAISVKKGSTSGTTTTCTKSSTTFTCANLQYNTSYYLYPTFSGNYEFSSWTKTDSVAGATLGSTTTENTYYTMGNGAGALTLASKSAKTYLQDLTAATCPSTVTTVYDKRDESEYRVQKLADGNCWMLDNLALDLTALTQAQLYGTGSDAGKMTNASNTTLGYLKNGGGSSPYTAYAVAAATSTNYYNRPAIAKSGTCYNAYCVNGGAAGSPWSYTDSTSVTINGVTSRVQGKIGIYYNYCAASAGSYCYSSSSSSGDATEDICPAGWHLPTGDTAKGSFYYLYNTGYSANYNNFVDALSTPLSGGFYSGTARGQGSSGVWWSSTRNGSNYMYLLSVNSSNVSPQGGSNRNEGYSVRCVMTPPTLYETIASMSKGTQTVADLRAAITVPTSADRTQDTSNSGVYEYNSSVFGTSSDAANTSKIYYYRGVLENSVGSYGSDGSAVTYPNYVILDANGTKDTSDTCWRIVRTTGSGGVKMIYNGKWTGSTCANATTAAQVITSAFNSSSASNGYTSLAYQNMHAVGYTYNPSVTGSTTAKAISTVLGSDSNYSVNSADSIMKQYIEKTWFTNINSYASILEPSAGFCNDRTVYPSGSYGLSNKLAESTTVVPYGTSDMTVYDFGPYARNMNTAQNPTLNCPRGTVDLYTASNASNGNKQLSKPAALLTADEVSFAGSGRSTAIQGTQGSSYHANSFLRSGSSFWLLSPFYRHANGYAGEFYLRSGGDLYSYYVNNAFGVRPAISLTSGTTASSGSGTATDPWVVTGTEQN